MKRVYLSFKSFALILTLSLQVFCLSGCFSRDYYTTSFKFDKDLKEIKNNIESEFNDYLTLPSPSIEELGVNDKTLFSLVWNVEFKKEYTQINDLSNPKISQVYLIERCREIYNCYIDNHPKSELRKCSVNFVFNEFDHSSLNGDHYLEMASLSNYCYPNSTLSDHLIMVDMKYDDFECLFDHDDIEIVAMQNRSIEDVLELSDKMPYVKYIYVADQQTADEASKLRPNVKFVSIE